MRLPISILTAGANKTLPPLPALEAASTWAQLLLAASVIANALGFDLYATLAGLGLGSTPDEVLSTGHQIGLALQHLSPIAFGLWGWLERKAPRYRITFWGRGS